MKVRYTRRAAHQLDVILDYIAERSPRGAQHVMDRIERALAVVAEHPYRAQAVEGSDMRRLVVNPYPYVVFYRVTAASVTIHGVRHAARRPQRR